MKTSSLVGFRDYYDELAMSRVVSRCSMALPGELAGKRVLDVCCRRGKGAFALSDLTGERGFVLGVDPSADDVAVARAKAPDNHWAGAEWQRYLRFAMAYPEDLSLAGVRDASFDVVYINCIVNCVASLPLALAEFARVLVPGGRLWVGEGVFRKDGGRDGSARVDEAVTFREAGADDPVFACAPTASDFEASCLRAGFAAVSYSEVRDIVFGDGDADGSLGCGYVCANACACIPA